MIVLKIGPNNDIDFKIELPDVNHSFYLKIKEYHSDDDIIKIVDILVEDLDCTVLFDGRRLKTTSQLTYKDLLSNIYYYILRLKDQVKYNAYIDKMIDIHIANVEFERNWVEPLPPTKRKASTKSKRTPPNKYVRNETRDMFTGEVKYIYINRRTDEHIYSDDPNLLDTLNAKPKREKKVKSTAVPMASMMFTFKKK